MWNFEIYNNIICVFKILFFVYRLKKIFNLCEWGDGLFILLFKSEKKNYIVFYDNLLYFY